MRLPTNEAFQITSADYYRYSHGKSDAHIRPISEYGQQPVLRSILRAPSMYLNCPLVFMLLGRLRNRAAVIVEA